MGPVVEFCWQGIATLNYYYYCETANRMEEMQAQKPSTCLQIECLLYKTLCPLQCTFKSCRRWQVISEFVQTTVPNKWHGTTAVNCICLVAVMSMVPLSTLFTLGYHMVHSTQGTYQHCAPRPCVTISSVIWQRPFETPWTGRRLVAVLPMDWSLPENYHCGNR